MAKKKQRQERWICADVVLLLISCIVMEVIKRQSSGDNYLSKKSKEIFTNTVSDPCPN
jgi:hypothetical protein